MAVSQSVHSLCSRKQFPNTHACTHTHTHTHTQCTFLAVQPLEAQGAVTLIALLPGPAASPMGTGGPHAGVGCILHVHTPREVMPHMDGPVIQDDLRKENIKKFRDSENHLWNIVQLPSAHQRELRLGVGWGFKNK